MITWLINISSNEHISNTFSLKHNVFRSCTKHIPWLYHYLTCRIIVASLLTHRTRQIEFHSIHVCLPLYCLQICRSDTCSFHVAVIPLLQHRTLMFATILPSDLQIWHLFILCGSYSLATAPLASSTFSALIVLGVLCDMQNLYFQIPCQISILFSSSHLGQTQSFIWGPYNVMLLTWKYRIEGSIFTAICMLSLDQNCTVYW
jgi:hypothetical protein